jgi:NAD(P)H-dependent flavin oxidoreductase YrpB (nitropropane dioxygenase family)
MLRTRICEMLGIDHPVVVGGMASGTNPPVVAAISGAGGLGILGVTSLSPEQQRADARNRFVERWAGREWEVRQRRGEIAAQMQAARERDDGDEANLQMGQTAGLITAITPAATIVREIVAEAERIIQRLPRCLG